MQVRVQHAVAVRARNDAQAAVAHRRRLQCHPHGAIGQRPDRPVVAVLVPRRLVAFCRRLAEDMAAPEDHVVPDHVGDQLDDVRVHRQFKEAPAAAHAFAVVAFDVRRDQLLGAHAGVVRDQPVERLAQLSRAVGGQAELRNQPAFAVVVLDVGRGQVGHGGRARGVWTGAPKQRTSPHPGRSGGTAQEDRPQAAPARTDGTTLAVPAEACAVRALKGMQCRCR
jgi:hypothetical protein